MSDGLVTVPIATDTGLVLGWGRGGCIVHGAAYHKERGTDLRFLRYADGEVVEISQEEKDAIIAQDAADAAQAAIDAANAPFVIDRIKLYNAVKGVGKGAEFRAFLAADEDRLFTWNSARELDSDNQMVVDATPWFQSLLPEGCTVRDFLLMCRV